MSQQDAWRSYFYPETWDGRQGTLINKFGERDPAVLSDREYQATEWRSVDLRLGRSDVSRTYDATHLRDLHREIFQDVYEWAGEFRRVEMVKGPPGQVPMGFASISPPRGQSSSMVEQVIGDAAAAVTSTDWPAVDRAGFAQGMAEVYGHLNHAHAFREGNGRTGKMFLEHVAELSPYQLDFSRVDQATWNEASELSRPQVRDLHNMRGVDPSPLVPVFEQMAVERPGGPTRSIAEATAARAAAAGVQERDSYSRSVSARERIFGAAGGRQPAPQPGGASYQDRQRRQAAEQPRYRQGRGRGD